MLGIDISRESIKIARLGEGAHRGLISHCWQDVPKGLIEQGEITDQGKMQQVLREALDKCHVVGKLKIPVIASIPETQSFLRVIDLPAMDAAEMNEAVLWEVAQHIPFGVENVYIGWQPVEVTTSVKPSDRQEVLVGAAEKRVVDSLLTLLQSLGLDVAVFELESQAIIRALISPELQLRKGLLVIDLGGSNTNVVVHDRGTTRFTASLQKGATALSVVLSKEEVAALAGPVFKDITQDFPDMAKKLQEGMLGIVAEIHGIVEFYTGLNADNQVNELLLTGGGTNLPGLADAFLHYFTDVHVQRGSPWVNVLSPGDNTRAPMGIHESVHFATALGLAMRKVII